MDRIKEKLSAVGDAIREKTGKGELLNLDEMPAEIAAIETGVELNFDVIKYNTEEELLAATPEENTIGVITESEITGYHFSAEQPESVIDGEVWLLIGTSSTVKFNVIEDGTVMIYPISVKQYIGGAWEEKTAKSYQNGEWVAWWMFLLNFADKCNVITGGYVLS
jgi:hypothetical protein